MDKVFQVIASETFIGCFFGILGVILGWVLNELSAKHRAKPKLCFRIIGTPESELVEKEARNKYSTSDYSIEIYNIGQNPFILENFTIVHKKKILVDCQIGIQDKAILPYKSMVYTMNEQEADALIYHCTGLELGECTIIATDVEQHRVPANLDASILTLGTGFSTENMIVTE